MGAVKIIYLLRFGVSSFRFLKSASIKKSTATIDPIPITLFLAGIQQINTSKKITEGISIILDFHKLRFGSIRSKDNDFLLNKVKY